MNLAVAIRHKKFSPIEGLSNPSKAVGERHLLRLSVANHADNNLI